ncbi:MAG: hypothetical protein A2Y12_11295 [Planctomycetes bacterium GWF2_42_9]|nr:MAG: hypothetical protein A2Y12_11295 [Planctomycetes bacterium GWF2_42_9]HAL45138.1 hypothetical protein [Phycisphaerales bacterium]
MYCQKCGADNLENAAICQSCGGVFVYSKPIKTSGMAITSMILSVSCFPFLGVFGIVWILGLVFGLIALNRINKSGGQLKGKGFAIAGIAVSSAGLAVLLTLVGVLLVFNSVSTISVHKKLKMQADNKQPEIAGLVSVVYNNTDDPNAIFSAPLFNTEELDSDSPVSGRLECKSPDDKPVVVQWEFMGEDEGKELYSFDILTTVDENKTSELVKTVEFDGKDELIYKDKTMKIYLTGEKE